MASSPVKVLLLVFLVLTFEALMFGNQLIEESFPEFQEPQVNPWLGPGGVLLDALLAVVQTIWGTVVLLFNAITFNVAGAPWFIRVPVGVAMGGSLFWSISTLIRGN